VYRKNSLYRKIRASERRGRGGSTGGGGQILREGSLLCIFTELKDKKEGWAGFRDKYMIELESGNRRLLNRPIGSRAKTVFCLGKKMGIEHQRV